LTNRQIVVVFDNKDVPNEFVILRKKANNHNQFPTCEVSRNVLKKRDTDILSTKHLVELQLGVVAL
jgi:hypothetical protein